MVVCIVLCIDVFRGCLCPPLYIRGDKVTWKVLAEYSWSPFALIVPIHPILHRVSCSNKMIPNLPRHYETHQNMSLGSIGVDRVDLLQKILTRLCGTNFCINCISSACFEPSIIKQRNGPKCTQTLRNATKHEY